MGLKNYKQPSHCVQPKTCEHKATKIKDLVENPLSNWCEECHEACCENCLILNHIQKGHKIDRNEFSLEERKSLLEKIPNAKNFEEDLINELILE